MKYEFGNEIYELTPEDKEMILEHEKFYKDLFEFGNEILDYGFPDTIHDYELTIYSYIYRVLEILDTLKVMTDSSLINSGFIIVRSLFETSAQLCYICEDKKQMEKRAIILQLLDIKRSCSDVDLFTQCVSNRSCYTPYVDCVTQNNFDNWYSYCEGKKTTFKALCKIAGWDTLYMKLYRPLSIETHEVNHMETNIVHYNEKFNFKPFRIFENHVLLLNCILSISNPLFTTLINLYGSEDLKKRWNLYSDKLGKYINDNNNISELEKVFNPSSKWF